MFSALPSAVLFSNLQRRRELSICAPFLPSVILILEKERALFTCTFLSPFSPHLSFREAKNFSHLTSLPHFPPVYKFQNRAALVILASVLPAVLVCSGAKARSVTPFRLILFYSALYSRQRKNNSQLLSLLIFVCNLERRRALYIALLPFLLIILFCN